MKPEPMYSFEERKKTHAQYEIRGRLIDGEIKEKKNVGWFTQDLVNETDTVLGYYI